METAVLNNGDYIVFDKMTDWQKEYFVTNISFGWLSKLDTRPNLQRALDLKGGAEYCKSPDTPFLDGFVPRTPPKHFFREIYFNDVFPELYVRGVESFQEDSTDEEKELTLLHDKSWFCDKYFRRDQLSEWQIDKIKEVFGFDAYYKDGPFMFFERGAESECYFLDWLDDETLIQFNDAFCYTGE